MRTISGAFFGRLLDKRHFERGGNPYRWFLVVPRCARNDATGLSRSFLMPACRLRA